MDEAVFIETQLKEQADSFLADMGLTTRIVIAEVLAGMLQRKELPANMFAAKPIALGSLPPEQLDAELQKGYDDILAGRVFSEREAKRLYRSVFE